MLKVGQSSVPWRVKANKAQKNTLNYDTLASQYNKQFILTKVFSD